MMYPFLTLDDQTEIVHSQLLDDGSVKVYVEKPSQLFYIVPNSPFSSPRAARLGRSKAGAQACSLTHRPYAPAVAYSYLKSGSTDSTATPRYWLMVSTTSQ